MFRTIGIAAVVLISTLSCELIGLSEIPLVIGDGEHRIGQDMHAGIYESASDEPPDPDCEWRVEGGPGYSSKDDQGRVTIYVQPHYETFTSQGCGEWVLVSSPTPMPEPTPKPTANPKPTPTPKPRRIENGEHIVGVDIAPGWYESQPADTDDGCLFERRDEDGFRIEWGLAIMLWNPNVEVEIKSTDYSFYSKDCKPWRPIPEPTPYRPPYSSPIK